MNKSGRLFRAGRKGIGRRTCRAPDALLIDFADEADGEAAVAAVTAIREGIIVSKAHVIRMTTIDDGARPVATTRTEIAHIGTAAQPGGRQEDATLLLQV